MLTFNQNQVANHTSGHAKVLAVAGSGKTTTMAERVQRLVDSGVNPKEIISVMFNRDARDSYKAKLMKKYGKDKCPPVFTFHGLASVILAQLIDMGKLDKCRLETSEYRLFTNAKDALEPYFGEIKAKRQTTMSFLSFVDLVKNSLDRPLDVFKEYSIPSKYLFFIDAFKAFEKHREKSKIRYFSDLIYDPIKLLIADKDLARQFENRYQHIIVDEFQDISDIQMSMIKIVAGKRSSVMVVGDDDQCIYSWRGAKPDYLISGFDKYFPNPTVFQLTETFRYGHQLALAAAHLIKNNSVRADKVCVATSNARATNISLDVEKVGQPSVPKHINQWTKSGRDIKEIAVLVRSYSQAIPIELSLLTVGIPYVLDGGTPLFDSPDIGALLSGLHIASGYFDRLSNRDKAKMTRMFISYPGLGLMRDEERELLEEAISSDCSDPAGALDAFTFKVKEQWVRERVSKRAMVFRNLQTMSKNDVSETIQYIIDETGVKHHIEYVAKNEEEADDLWARYDAIETYVKHIDLNLFDAVSHLESLRKGVDENGDRGNSLLITSVHRSKGLEWPFVIMPGLSQGKFPLIPKNSEQQTSIEEERRLFYVGMTRAQEKLIMICPNDRRLQLYLGKGSDKAPEIIEPDPANASQFIYECNIFLSQRADLIVSGNEKIPNGVASPESARLYLDQFSGLKKLPKAG